MKPDTVIKSPFWNWNSSATAATVAPDFAVCPVETVLALSFGDTPVSSGATGGPSIGAGDLFHIGHLRASFTVAISFVPKQLAQKITSAWHHCLFRKHAFSNASLCRSPLVPPKKTFQVFSLKANCLQMLSVANWYTHDYKDMIRPCRTFKTLDTCMWQTLFRTKKASNNLVHTNTERCPESCLQWSKNNHFRTPSQDGRRRMTPLLVQKTCVFERLSLPVTSGSSQEDISGFLTGSKLSPDTVRRALIYTCLQRYDSSL